MVTRLSSEYLLAMVLLLSLPAVSVGNDSFPEQSLTKVSPAAITPITLPDLSGQPVTTEFTKQVTILHFWATWCVPCQKELPELELLQKKYKSISTLKVQTIATDNPDVVKSFMDKSQIKLNVLIDQYGKALYQYKVDVLPKTYVIDQDSTLRYVAKGYINWQDENNQDLLIKLTQE